MVKGMKKWLNKLREEQDFTFPSQLPPLDFSGYSGLNCHFDLSMKESAFDALALMESFVPTDPFCLASDDHLAASPSLTQEDFTFGYEDEFGIWNDEMNNASFELPENQELQLLCDDNNNEGVEGKKVKKCRSEEKTNNGSKTLILSRDIISQYFYLPITQAAKELNIGLTLLKKRCREVGIRRWPHRKLMSLQTLIKNVQELGLEEGEGGDKRLTKAIEMLENERKLMEETPDLKLEDKTKRLRQTCFKATYKKKKKRKLMGISLSSSTNSTNPPIPHINYGTTRDDNHHHEEEGEEEEEEEEVGNLLSEDCLNFFP